MTNSPPPGANDGLLSGLRALGERLQSIASAVLPDGLRGVLQRGDTRDGESQDLLSSRLQTGSTSFDNQKIGDVEARPSTDFQLLQTEAGGGEAPPLPVRDIESGVVDNRIGQPTRQADLQPAIEQQTSPTEFTRASATSNPDEPTTARPEVTATTGQAGTPASIDPGPVAEDPAPTPDPEQSTGPGPVAEVPAPTPDPE